MKRRINGLLMVLGVILLLSAPTSVHTCVGRILTIAIGDSIDQQIMGQMLSVLINERTGTTVNLLKSGNVDKCHESVLEGKANIYIGYIGMGQGNTAGPATAGSVQEVFALVKQSYSEKFGMIWLKPFGFDGPCPLAATGGKDAGTLAAPIATNDVLRKFPVLDRVINKLNGKIDNKVMEGLVKEAETQDVKVAVTEFLKAQKLI